MSPLEPHKSYDRETFVGLVVPPQQVIAGEFSRCVFRNCNLFRTNLSDGYFSDCTFDGCDLSMVGLRNTRLNNVEFVNCKLLGDNFEFCKYDLGFSANFVNCVLDLSNFSGAKIRKCAFRGSSFKEASFLGAALTKCDFSGCDFSDAVFDGTDLTESNFASATNYAIDPSRNKVKKAVFSLPDVVGLLGNLDIRIKF